MPGIVGLVTTRARPWAEDVLGRMVETLRHEPFYATGTWIDESLGVYVGWVARKNSFADGMPLRSPTGDVVLVFSGEDFRESGTVRRLGGAEHDIDPAVPTYLVRLYQNDPSFPAGLNGRFHGLVADRSRGTALLFNDRYGLQRIYHHAAREAFYFAAEAKAILAVRPELRRVDPRGLGEFLSCGCVLEDRTLFPDLGVLPCAAAWSFRNGSLEGKRAYFEPREWEEQPLLEPDVHYRQIREVFARNLPRYFEGREAVALSLTGGLDTRMIVAWHKAPPGALRCYTFGGMFRDSRDVLVARRVARLLQQPHEVIHVGEDFLSHFPRYAERTVYLTDGCAEVSHACDLYVNERAREIAPVRMTGNYGGEVLRRVRAFKPVRPLPGLFDPELAPHFAQAERTYGQLLRGHPLSFALFKQAPWHHYGLLALEQTQLSLRSPFLDTHLVRTLFQAPEFAATSDDVSLRLIADGNAALRLIRSDRGLAGPPGRISSALARRMQEFLFKAEYAYDYGMPQWLARVDHWLSPLRLERAFLGRHKFYHFRAWYRNRLSRYVKEVLLDPRALARPYLERKQLEAVVHGHLTGQRNYTTEIHKVLTLELLQRLFVDGR